MLRTGVIALILALASLSYGYGEEQGESYEHMLRVLLEQKSPEQAERLAKVKLDEQARRALTANLDAVSALLNSEADSLVYWTAILLGNMGPEAKAAVPALIAVLERKVPDYVSKSCTSGVYLALDAIDAEWIKRKDVSRKIRDDHALHSK